MAESVVHSAFLLRGRSPEGKTVYLNLIALPASRVVDFGSVPLSGYFSILPNGALINNLPKSLEERRTFCHFELFSLELDFLVDVVE